MRPRLRCAASPLRKIVVERCVEMVGVAGYTFFESVPKRAQKWLGTPFFQRDQKCPEMIGQQKRLNIAELTNLHASKRGAGTGSAGSY